uniref:Uncharacterized protein n=1 Tax=Arundo donax TaxID=35708 RepID=A0A0A9CC05_ARUDO
MISWHKICTCAHSCSLPSRMDTSDICVHSCSLLYGN